MLDMCIKLGIKFSVAFNQTNEPTNQPTKPINWTKPNQESARPRTHSRTNDWVVRTNKRTNDWPIEHPNWRTLFHHPNWNRLWCWRVVFTQFTFTLIVSHRSTAPSYVALVCYVVYIRNSYHEHFHQEIFKCISSEFYVYLNSAANW